MPPRAPTPRRQSAPAAVVGQDRRAVCLRATISFDGKLLADSADADADAGGPAAWPAPDSEPGPVWWQRLLTRKSVVPAEAETVRALFEAGKVGELCLRVRPCIDGRRAQPTLSGPAGAGAAFFPASIPWTLARMATTASGDCLLYYRRADG